MENLNAEELKQALKRCASGGRCKGCVRENITTYTIEGCMGVLLGEALALIESQDQKIFELEKRLKECENGYEGTLQLERCKLRDAEEMVNELTDENDKLHASCTELARVQEENERLRASHTDRSEQKNHLHIIVDGKETGTWDGIIYVFCEERAKRIILTASGDQSDRFLSLDDCLDEIGCKETESAIVIIEDSLHGDVYRFGNYADRSWYKVGETVGYA